MKNKNLNVFSIFVLAIFFLALSFFGISVGVEIQKGKKSCTQNFNQILENTISYINKYSFSNEFSTKYSQLIKQNENVAALIISENNEAIFAYPMTSSIVKIDKNSQPTINSSSALVKIFSKNISEFEKNLTLTVAIYLITPDKIFFYARITFIIILCATILVFAILLYVYSKYKTPKTENSTIPESKKAENPQTQNITEKHDISFSEQKIRENENSSSENEKISEFTEEQNSIENNQNADENYIQELEAFNEEENISDPIGIYSNETGISTEKSFTQRLDAELSNCVSSEQDLAVLLLKIENFPIKSHESSSFISVLLYNIKDRSKIFEYNKDTFAIILPNYSFDETMLFSTKIYGEIQNVINEKQLSNKIAIGISNRSLRIIPAERIINEAKQALDKALEQDAEMAIVAFKVDLEKYKQEITG